MNKEIVRLENVTKRFGKHTVINKINLSIYEGEFLTLLGPSGCGKTMILRMISGLTDVTSGRVYIEDKDVTNLDPSKREVNTIFQNFALFPHMTVFRNVAFGLETRHVPKNEIEKRVKEAIEFVNLKGFEDRYPRELSGGQQQRVAIARGIVTKPKVLLLDESLCSLDLKLKRKMQIELRKMQQKLGITFIYVTHDQNEAITMSDRIAIINNSGIEQIGTPREIYDNPTSIFTADFIGDSNIFDATIKTKNKETMTVESLDKSLSLKIKACDFANQKDNIKIMIRPEYITVSKNKLSDSFNGIITDIIYMGDYSKLYVTVGELIFKADFNNIDLFKIGDKVHIKFDKDYVVAIRNDEK